MNIYVDKIDDIRLSINDIYMSLLMTGWMFLFMGICDKRCDILIFGLVLVLSNFYFIRIQFLVDERQYKLGMIPHHSMAIHMSKKLLEKGNVKIKNLVKNIIISQEKEIFLMKK
jgi:hypothetical protein